MGQSLVRRVVLGRVFPVFAYTCWCRAGAGFGGGSTKDDVQVEMLKASFRSLWEIAERHPESSVKVSIQVHVQRMNSDADYTFLEDHIFALSR
jgi:hypothetical protein